MIILFKKKMVEKKKFAQYIIISLGGVIIKTLDFSTIFTVYIINFNIINTVTGCKTL